MSDTIWNLFIELRKELMESQKLRSQIIGFKITFVSATIGLMGTKLSTLDHALFVVPAFAAIFFDLIIYSYSFSIKRIGRYTHEYIEPELKRQGLVSTEFIMWQEFLTQPKTKQNLAIYGNIGLTTLVVVIGSIALFFPFRPLLSTSLLLSLAIFVVMDIVACQSHRRLDKLWSDVNFDD